TTLLGSPLRFQTSGPQYIEGVGDALNPETIGGASEETSMDTAEFLTGSRTITLSVISEAPYTNPLAFILGLRTSDAASSERPSFGVPQSHSVMTRLRSTPAGRGGVALGASSFAMRSDQSANIFRLSPIARKNAPMDGPEGPTFVRRSQASS